MANSGFWNIFREFFAWWRGNTWGTRLWVATRGVFVGEDAAGNRYYRSKKPDGPHGCERRMVVYAGGYAEPTTIPPGWYGWMHYRIDQPPRDGDYVPHAWERSHLANLTGTRLAYRPEGSLTGDRRRPRVTGDYDAWSPE